jgi:hypothetical protein
MKGQEPSDVGQYAGWGTDDDAPAAGGEGERTGPGMMPFLRYKAGDRWWKLGLGFAYLPAVIAVITIEDWMHLSQSWMWITLGLFYVAFVATIYLSQRK